MRCIAVAKQCSRCVLSYICAFVHEDVVLSACKLVGREI
jgi:hypothetical protein